MRHQDYPHRLTGFQKGAKRTEIKNLRERGATQAAIRLITGEGLATGKYQVPPK